MDCKHAARSHEDLWRISWNEWWRVLLLESCLNGSSSLMWDTLTVYCILYTEIVLYTILYML